MTRGRESSDRWARYAHHLLDRVRKGGKVPSPRIDWALSYLGDKDGCVKVPPRSSAVPLVRAAAAHPAPARAHAFGVAA